MLTGPVLAQPARSTPAQAAVEEPPYRRQLGEDDAKRVVALEKKIEELSEADKLTEAQVAARTILEIRQRVQGADHWETADARRLLRTLEQTAARPANARAKLAEATKLDVEIARLSQRGRYADAVPLQQRALDIRQRYLGGEHPDAARAMDDLGFFLENSGKPKNALPLHEKALAIRRQVLGEHHPDTATSYENLAVNLNTQGRYPEAQPLYEKALAIRRQVLGEHHPDTASSYNNLAYNLNAQGRYAEAEPLFRKALAIYRQALGEADSGTASSYNNLAANLTAQGRYPAAEPLLRKALVINRQALGEAHPRTASSYGNLALNLHAQGRYAEAEPLFRKALGISRHALGEAHADTGRSYGSLAYNLDAQGRYAEAEPLFRKALAIYRQTLGQAHPRTASSYNNLATNLNAQGRYDEAEPLLRKALAIRRQALGQAHFDTAQSYNNLAYNLNAQGKSQEAQESWIKASHILEVVRLRSSSAGLERAYFAAHQSSLLPLTCSLARAGKALEAWRFLEGSLARGLLDAVLAGRLRPLREEERKRQQTLSANLDQFDKQITALVIAKEQTEAGRGKLRELIRQRQAAEAELAQIAAAQSAREIYDLDHIQLQLSAEAALLAWVDVPGKRQATNPNGEHWACVVRHQGPPVWVKLPGSGPQGAWTKDDDDLPHQFQRALSTSASENERERQKLVSRLAAQRLGPLEAALRGDTNHPPVKHLLVEPAWWMAGVPVEALTDKYTVSYVPSGTMFARLREKRLQAPGQSTDRPRLLAVGDPVFTRPELPQTPEAALPANGLLIARVTPKANAAESGIQPGDVLLKYGGFTLTNLDDLKTALAKQSPAKSGEELRIPVEVWRDGKTLPLHVRSGPLGIQTSSRPAKEELLAKREGDRILRSSHGKDWPALPGTHREVEAIARLFDQPVTLLGSEASEQRLDALAESGALKGFRYLHFATHGEVNDRIALESALILAQDHLPDPVDQMLAGKYPYDGRLTAAEMRRWQLDAELVTLSACETGLGQRLGGEGYLGFAQALFLAGTRSVVLSLWRVDDTATALLMTRFYQNLLGKRKGLERPMAKAEALQEAKQWLRGLTADQAAHEAADLPAGVRGRPAAIPTPPKGAAIPHLFADPYYWSAFILIGDPD